MTVLAALQSYIQIQQPAPHLHVVLKCDLYLDNYLDNKGYDLALALNLVF